MKLIIEDDEGRKTVVPFVREEISVGRKDGNTIRLTERNVSRRHARLMRQNGHVFIEDLGSYNGVKVNGDAVKGRAEIGEGDLIEIGDYNLAVQIEAGELVATQRADSGEGVTRPVSAPAPIAGQQAAAPQAGTPPPRPAAPPPRPQAAAQPAPQAAAPAQPQPRPAPQAAPSPAPADAAPVAQPAPAPDQEEPAAPRREATAVIRVDIDALNRRADQRSIPPEERPRLVGLTTEYAGRSFEVTKASVGIGRTEDNDVAIDHRSMSRNHCKIYRDHDDGLWKVADLGSANGVRVNGEDYGLIDLRAGDVIELGHVKLRWCEAGDDFVYSPEAAPAAASARGPAPAPASAPAGKGLSPVLLGAVGLLLVAGLGGGAFLLFGGDKTEDTDSGAATSADDKPGAAAVAEAIRQAVQEAGDAVQREDWEAAKAAYQRVLALDSSNAAATSGLERVSTEADARGRYESALAAMKGEKWSEALTAFQAIPESSIYHERAGSHVDQARAKHVTVLAGEAEASFRAKAWDEALEHAEAALAIAPDHTGAAGVRDRARQMIEREEAQREQEAEKRRRDEERRKRREAQRDRPPRTSSPTVKPVAAADRTDEARESFDLGYRLIQKRKYKEAVPPLEKALSLDPTGQSKAHALLGTAYANLGNSAQAAKHYRRFLQTNPNHPQAPQVKKILEEFEKYNKK